MVARWCIVVPALVLGCPADEPSADGGPERHDAVGADTGSHEDGRQPSDADAGGGSEPDADAGPGSGPLTFVADEHQVIMDRLCDLDGDGATDNAAADLGAAQGAIIAATLTSYLGDPEDAFFRWLFHFPWIDDLGRLDDAATTLIFANGEDLDSPPDQSDDFTGDETFRVRSSSVDGCGEPRSAFPSTAVDGGTVETRVTGSLFLNLGEGVSLEARSGSILGTIEPSRASADWLLCGALLVQDLGPVSAALVGAGDRTMLEILVGGGAAIGVPAVPGVSPDLDLDGDGLERVVVDDEGRVLHCIDGDLSTIEGRDCWRDERMADAISINLRFGTVPAHLADQRVTGAGTCETPPERSLWDPP